MKNFSLLILFLSCLFAHEFDLNDLKKRVKDVFYFAYDNYNKYAFPYDELKPVSCTGQDTWGSFSLSLVDSLDTLVVLGNHTEFKKACDKILNQIDLSKDINISVFETNIRMIGGLLSAHLLSKKAKLETGPGWPCSGPLLELAEKFADKLLPAFDTQTFLPYGTINLKSGRVPTNETTVSCIAGVGTFILEFGMLSRLTGDQRYEKAAIKALKSIWKYRSSLGLLGNHIDIQTGEWTANDATIGSGTDSIFEYLVKGSAMFNIPELHAMFIEYKNSIDKHLNYGDWYFMANRESGQVTMAVFQSLETFWPGLLILNGEISKAVKLLINYHKVWKKYGFFPEMYTVISESTPSHHSAYPLRPEFIESVMYAYRATRDERLLEIGVDFLHSIETSARTKCGYATVSDVTTHELEDRMESFFLAETTKYLYLLFDEENFFHDVISPNSGTEITMPSGSKCRVNAGGYILNTEAHILDPGALDCCYNNQANQQNFFEKNSSDNQEIQANIYEKIKTNLNLESSSPRELKHDLGEIVNKPSTEEDIRDLAQLYLDTLAVFEDETWADERLNFSDYLSVKKIEKYRPLMTCPYPGLIERIFSLNAFDFTPK